MPKVKQKRAGGCYSENHLPMTKPANSPDKPSPTDTPTEKSHDSGHKSVVKKSDKQYSADQPHGGDIAKKHESEEQPVEPVKTAPES